MSRKNVNRRSNQSGVKTQMNALKSSLHGHANDLRAIAPVSFTRKPFNTITVEEVVKTFPNTGGSAIITLQSLIGRLRSQLELSPESNTGTPKVTLNNLSVKIKRIDLFSKPAGNDNVCSVRGYFYSLVPLYGLGPSQIGAQVPMKCIEDIGLTGAEYAKVSYTYPRDQSDMPLSVIVDQPGAGHLAICKITPGQSSDTVVARYHLLWNTGIEQDGQLTYDVYTGLPK